MKRRRWVSWAAVSSLPQAKKISLDEQLERNRALAEQFGGTIVEELSVPGESRSIVLFEDAAGRIPAYARLRELVDARSFDVFVYYDRSRLGRRASLSMSVVELCRDAGIICVEAESPPATLEQAAGASYDDLLIGAIKSVGAQQEVAKLTERQRMGMIHRVKKGLAPGRMPFGYRLSYDPKTGAPTVDVDLAEAGAVRRIFELYLQGLGFNAVAAILNQEGAPKALANDWTPAAEGWTKAGVRVIIMRAWTYAGFAELNVRSRNRPYVRAPAAWDAIISEETARAAIDEQTQRGHSRRLANTPHLLSGVAWCADCNRRLTIGRYANRTQLYCPNKHAGGWIDSRKIMEALATSFAWLADENIDRYADEEDDPTGRLAADIDRYAGEGRRLDTALQRADDAYTDGLLDAGRYERQVNRLAAERAAIDAKIAELREAIAEYRQAGSRRQRLEEIREASAAMMAHANVTLANAWLRRFVRVWCAGSEVAKVDFL